MQKQWCVHQPVRLAERIPVAEACFSRNVPLAADIDVRIDGITKLQAEFEAGVDVSGSSDRGVRSFDTRVLDTPTTLY